MNSNVRIKRISSEEEMWYAQRLYVSGFPEWERRNVEDWIRLSFNEPAFHSNVIFYDANMAGFITYWDFSDFFYVEHFAIDKAMRGEGIGGKAIDLVCDMANNAIVVLEVELPVGEVEKKRISFYNKHGFTLCNKTYFQPPYKKGGESIEMKIMWKGNIEIEDVYDGIVERIYKKVYGLTGTL